MDSWIDAGHRDLGAEKLIQKLPYRQDSKTDLRLYTFDRIAYQIFAVVPCRRVKNEGIGRVGGEKYQAIWPTGTADSPESQVSSGI